MGLRGRTRLTDYSLFFVTTTCHDFLPLIESKEMKDLLIENLNHYNEKYDAEIVAYALMPEHIHLMIYFRNGNHLIEYMRDFKRFTSKKIQEYWAKTKPDVLGKLAWCRNPNSDTASRQKYKVWMDRFDDLHLYSSRVCIIKLRYINKNPVERGLCYVEEDYDYSSAAFYNGKPDNKIPLTHLRDLL